MKQDMYDEDYISYVEEQEELKREEEWLAHREQIENEKQLEVQAREEREQEIAEYEKNWY